jgi:hypothetical protein
VTSSYIVEEEYGWNSMSLHLVITEGSNASPVSLYFSIPLSPSFTSYTYTPPSISTSPSSIQYTVSILIGFSVFPLSTLMVSTIADDASS